MERKRMRLAEVDAEAEAEVVKMERDGPGLRVPWGGVEPLGSIKGSA